MHLNSSTGSGRHSLFLMLLFSFKNIKSEAQ